MLLFRTVVAALALLGLALQYAIVITGSVGPGPLARTINFLSYFTILGNILVALAMILPRLAASPTGRFFARPAVRAGIASYIVMVGAVYVLVLRSLWDPRGLDLVADTLLHYATPLLYAVDWLLLVPKGALTPKHAVAWLAFPIAYVVWTLAHGALSGFYPYPFIDVGVLGYPRVLMNIAGLFVAFLALGLLLVAVDRSVGAVQGRLSGRSTAKRR